jgi:hypothetical protein
MPKGFFGFLSRHLTRRVQDAHGGLSEMILSAQHLARVGVEGSNPFARSIFKIKDLCEIIRGS